MTAVKPRTVPAGRSPSKASSLSPTPHVSHFSICRTPSPNNGRIRTPPPAPNDEYEDLPALIPVEEAVDSCHTNNLRPTVPLSLDPEALARYLFCRPSDYIPLDSDGVARYVQAYVDNAPQSPSIIPPLFFCSPSGVLSPCKLRSGTSPPSPSPPTMLHRGALAYHFEGWSRLADQAPPEPVPSIQSRDHDANLIERVPSGQGRDHDTNIARSPSSYTRRAPSPFPGTPPLR
ncbi:hypothetical protein DFP72DRAFT_852626 [Ephemerocybe angulata]|uniref:Uncharacterized protein n=1 Tax=Ephemerocybe angulata TaxID=980116 RepID=A0A8H6HLG0_9AGAR|nr:hypothetical protein DFP72DRAFT_852626 [Tulosesus angulatus]